MNNMLIAQSGGPTVAVNASLSGAIKRAMKHTEIDGIFGARNGIEGVLEENFVDFRRLFHEEEDFVRLKATPAMILGSCRKRLAEKPDETYEKILNIFHKYEIKYFFYIGGNDSMDTVMKLSAYFMELGEDIKVVGIPKTIDNDLAVTDHTPGFGSAARYIATTVAEIACDSDIYSAPSITVVEIMGRNAGWLTAAAALARREGCTAPHIILLPEVAFDEEAFLKKVKEEHKKHHHLIIAASEGIKTPDGQYLSAASKPYDSFGHTMLSGVGNRLKELLSQHFSVKMRAIELNVLQRAAGHLKSETDIHESSRIGAEAVSMAVAGKTGAMMTYNRLSNHPYIIKFDHVNISEVANIEKKIPLEWIGDMDVTEELIEYLYPLILNTKSRQGGIPAFFTLTEADSFKW